MVLCPFTLVSLQKSRDTFWWNSVLNSLKANYIIKKLILQGKLLPNIQVISNNRSYEVIIYDNFGEDRIFPDIAAAGAAANFPKAILKALSEYSERTAFREKCNEYNFMDTAGFAAYPKAFNLQSVIKKKTRHKAYCEAIERYASSLWWHNVDIKSKQENIPYENFLSSHPNVADYKIKELKLIEPLVQKPYHLAICVARLFNNGMIAGCAAGHIKERSATIHHALIELNRHLIAENRARNKNISPTRLYEKKLMTFALDDKYQLLEDRLKQRGSREIIIPSLEIDMPIAYSLDKLFYVHVCKLQHQYDYCLDASDFPY